MSTSISTAFIKQFEREVHETYQRQGSKLRAAVRTIGNVKGSSVVFQKIGKGTASTKSTHGMVPVMNLAHSTAECLLQDYYAGDWVDKLDELKIQHDERQVIASAGAYALGRKTDELIITALAGATTYTVADANTGLTRDKVLAAFEKLGQADVPDDGQRFAVVGWKQWSELLKIQEFASSDFVGPDQLPYKGLQAKTWLGTTWIPHSGLPIDGSDIRSCYWFHKTAVGHAAGSDVQTDITWHGDRASFFVNNLMSQGASLIDAAGVVTLYCDETPD
ncbi:MAG: phage capsid protein [Pseudobdellovibrionaceae bacterium]